jgi:hypothetical protein
MSERKPPIDFSRVRRVRIDGEPTPHQLKIERERRELAEALAHQRLTEADDGATT